MKKKSCLFIIILIIFLISAINVSKSIKEGKMPIAKKVCAYISVPFVSLGNNIGALSGNTKIFFTDKQKLRDKAEKLEEENIRLKAENETLKALAYKTEELEKLLDFKQKGIFESKGAEVLYYSPSHWFKNAVIDFGEEDGARKGFAVVGKDGFIGQIKETSKHLSVIESVTSENTAIGGTLRRNGTKGLVMGDGSEVLIFTYLKYDADINMGDTVITGGEGDLIPSGIPIGKIIGIKRDKLTNSSVASIKPFSEFNNSDNILIMLSRSHLRGENF
ncbi:MAG: rod shape-determining protein MreC [Armatimonadetes bacterium]|nr:rod shape-determining protein MreC [Candidatus Hippobium faecium]